MGIMELGGSISLDGFSDIDRDKLVVIKKIIGNHVRQISETAKDFENVLVTLKPVSEPDGEKIYAVEIKLVCAGNPRICESADRNLFMAIDAGFKNIRQAIQ